jgi:hypothetical protein
MQSMAKKSRSGVSDRARAEVFAADKGMCAYTGKSLWVLDYGLVPLIEWDWVDHARPLARGGRNDLENLACCGSFRNWIKGNNTRDNYPILLRGRPTEDCLWHAETFSDSMFETLRRHATLAPSDWYFNRAILNILTWAEARYDRDDREPKDYWCQSAWKRLNKWQEMSAEQRVPSFERRSLVLYPRSADTRLILSLRTAERYSDLTGLATAFYEHFAKNFDAYCGYIDARTLRQRLSISRRYRRTSPARRSAAMVQWFTQMDRRHADVEGQLVALD